MIPLFKVKMSDKAKVLAAEVLDSGFIGQGPKVEELENLLKNRFNNLLTLTVNSATSGLTLALHLLKKPYAVSCGHAPGVLTWPGLEPGDEVLTSPLTCTATNWPILSNGLNIKWVDVDPLTCNMDLDDLQRKITPKTKVILLVHWGGNPIDLNKVKSIQEHAALMIGFKPVVIEDCAHAMGAKLDNKYLGNHGNIAVYSFQAIKHFTTGDGGCMIFPHTDLYNRAKLLRWFGIDRNTNSKDFRCEDNIPEYGFKYHMNDINASIGIANFPLIDSTVKAHQNNSRFYNEYIFNSKVKSVPILSNAESAQWIHTIMVEDNDSFAQHMKSKNIMVSRVHERNDKHSCVSKYKSMLPNLDKTVKHMICIPNGWWLSKEEREYICKTINQW